MKTMYRIFAIVAFAMSAYLWDASKVGDIQNIPCMFESMFAFISGWGFAITALTAKDDTKLPSINLDNVGKGLSIVAGGIIVICIVIAIVYNLAK